MLASLAFWLRGEKPLLLDLKTVDGEDHVVALFKQGGYWGAVSKTNHSSLRYRDPVYKNIRELAMSYFHEYYSAVNNKRTLRSYSKPFDLTKISLEWITAERELDDIVEKLDHSPHFPVCSPSNLKLLRMPHPIEIKADALTEWSKTDPRT